MLKPIIKIYKAIGYSISGLITAAKSEIAFRQEMVTFAFAFPFIVLCSNSMVEFCLLFGAGMLVFVAELLNSAIELAVDRIGTEYHELAGKAKDLGSAAVFMSIINAAVIWFLLLLWPYRHKFLLLFS